MMKSRKWSEPRRQRAHAPKAPIVSLVAMTVTMTENPLADLVHARAQLSLVPVLVEEESRTRSSMCKSFRSQAKV